jgi:hypothetical protein
MGKLIIINLMTPTQEEIENKRQMDYFNNKLFLYHSRNENYRTCRGPSRDVCD